MRLVYCLVAALTAFGCSSSGELVHVTIADSSALPATLAKVVATVSIDGQSSGPRTLAVASGVSTLDFGVGVASKYVGSMVSVTVQLQDAGGQSLGSGMGSGLIIKGTTEVIVNIGGGGGDSLCGNVAGPALCDGFESGLASFWTVVNSGGGSNTLVSQEHAFRGKSSLHVTTDAVDADLGTLVFATLTQNTFLPTTLFVRAYVWVPTGFDPRPGGVLTYEQRASPFAQITLDLEQQGFTVFDSLDDSSQHSQNALLQNDQWVCLEWSVVEGSKGATTLEMNGTPVAGLAMPVNTMAAPPYDQLALGLISTVPGTAQRDLYIDEVIIDSAHIGCAK